MTAKLPRRSRKKSTAIDPTRIGKFLRLLASDKPGEVVAAAAALKRTLEAGGLDIHDLASAIESGLKPAPPPQRRSLGPPSPNLNDWQSICWWLHFHRGRLRGDQRERVADYLLGQAFYDSDGRCLEWHMEELRGIVAQIRRDAVEDSPW
jgi:hypothetical protein